MWKTILNNINNLILSNWKSVFFLIVGILMGMFCFSCSLVNSAVDTVQEAGNDVVDFVTGEDDEEASEE
jgi:hypothetical protein